MDHHRPLTQEEVELLVDAWHYDAQTHLELHEYLGWTWDEYIDWVATGKIPW